MVNRYSHPFLRGLLRGLFISAAYGHLRPFFYVTPKALADETLSLTRRRIAFQSANQAHPPCVHLPVI